MVNPLSLDLRERAIARVLAGESCRSVAAVLAVSPSSVIKWAQLHRRTGSVVPGKMNGHRRPVLVGKHRDSLLERVERDQNVTLHGLAQELRDRGVQVTYQTVWIFLKREGKSFKKNRVSG